VKSYVYSKLLTGLVNIAHHRIGTVHERIYRHTLREDEVLPGGRSMKAMRSLVKLKIGGFTGAIASLPGKSPPGLRYWLVTGDVPAFVKFEGAMFLNGPVWRLELTTVDWPG
jgi:hypothetical protein